MEYVSQIEVKIKTYFWYVFGLQRVYKDTFDYKEIYFVETRILIGLGLQ